MSHATKQAREEFVAVYVEARLLPGFPRTNAIAMATEARQIMRLGLHPWPPNRRAL